MIQFTFFWVALLAHSTIAAQETGCSINPLVNTKSPLVLLEGSTEFLYPTPGEKTLSIKAGETVELICPGSKLVVENTATQEIVQATCISNRNFEISGESVQFNQLRCSGVAVAEGKKNGNSCASNTGIEAEIGFSLTDGRFLRTILVCFDTVNQNPIWSHYNLTASIGIAKYTSPRPSFEQDSGFYSTGSYYVNQLYSRSRQRTTINNLIGLKRTNTTYIKADSTHFLSRGHLTARADFVYPAQQNSTFRYINAAPQFQTFNGANWNEAEIAVRDYVKDKEVDLQVWTGLYGVTTLPHATTGEDIGLALYVDSKGNQGLLVPELYWKLAYNPESKRGIVLLGVNNPYQEDVDKSIICTDVSNNVSWLTFDMENLDDGYSYACSIPDFKKVVKTLPDLDVDGLLE